MANLNRISVDVLTKGIDKAAEQAKQEITDAVSFLSSFNGDLPKIITDAKIVTVGVISLNIVDQISKVQTQLVGSKIFSQLVTNASDTEISPGKYRIITLVYPVEV